MLILDRAVDSEAAADERRRTVESQPVVVRTLRCCGGDLRVKVQIEVLRDPGEDLVEILVMVRSRSPLC
jgi:hypothetical protein